MILLVTASEERKAQPFETIVHSLLGGWWWCRVWFQRRFPNL